MSSQPVPSPLLALPTELRLQIYDHLWPTQGECGTKYTTEGASFWWVADDGTLEATPHTATLQTCKTLRREALPIFYDHISFFISINQTVIPSEFAEVSQDRTSTREILRHARHFSLRVVAGDAVEVEKATRDLDSLLLDCLGRGPEEERGAGYQVEDILLDFYPRKETEKTPSKLRLWKAGGADGVCKALMHVRSRGPVERLLLLDMEDFGLCVSPRALDALVQGVGVEQVVCEQKVLDELGLLCMG